MIALLWLACTPHVPRSALPEPDGADLVLLYGGEQDGDIGPCGCQVHERGGIGRVMAYRTALQAESPAPVLLLNPGGYMALGADAEGTGLRADLARKDAGMAEALAASDWSALGVGYRDAPFLVDANVANVVSANVRPTNERWPTFLKIPTAGPSVAVTSISPVGVEHLQPAAVEYRDPIESLRKVVPQMKADGSLVVVLMYFPGPLAEDIAEQVPGIDLIIEAGGFEERWEPIHVGDTLWVRTYARTERLHELRIDLEGGRIAGAIERGIDLDDHMPSVRAIDRIEETFAPEAAP